MKNKALQQILDKFKGIEPKYFFIGLGVAALLVLAADLFLLGRWQLAALDGIDKRTAQARTDLESLLANKQRMSSFRDGLDKARESLRAFKIMVHKEDSIPSVLKDVSTMANQYGVKIDQIVPQKSDGKVLVKNEDGSYRSLSILVRGRAGYHDLGRFLDRLQLEGVFWQLEAVDVMADASDPARHLVKVQMKVLILGEQ